MKEAKESSYEYPPCDADKEIEYLIRARYSMVYVVTWEEQRVLDSIHGICEKDNIGIPDIHVWDAGRGLTTYLGTPVTKDPLLTPEQILDHITREVEVELNLSDKDRLKASRARSTSCVICSGICPAATRDSRRSRGNYGTCPPC